MIPNQNEDVDDHDREQYELCSSSGVSNTYIPIPGFRPLASLRSCRIFLFLFRDGMLVVLHPRESTIFYELADWLECLYPLRGQE